MCLFTKGGHILVSVKASKMRKRFGVWGFCIQYPTDIISKTKSVFQGCIHMSALVLCRPFVCSWWSRSTCAVGSEMNSYQAKHFQSICLVSVKLQRELQLNLSFSQMTYKSSIIAYTSVAILSMPSIIPAPMLGNPASSSHVFSNLPVIRMEWEALQSWCTSDCPAIFQHHSLMSRAIYMTGLKLWRGFLSSPPCAIS